MVGCDSTSCIGSSEPRIARACPIALRRRPALRAGFPAMLGRMARRRNSLRSLRSLRSDICAKSVIDARCARGPSRLRFSAPPKGDGASPDDPWRGRLVVVAGSSCASLRLPPAGREREKSEDQRSDLLMASLRSSAPSPAGRERVGVRVGMVPREPPSPRPSPASGRGRNPKAGAAIRCWTPCGALPLPQGGRGLG